MRPGDRLICSFFKSHKTGHRFTRWPLHVTIVPWFRLETPSAKFADNLKSSLVGSKAFNVAVEQEAQFGYKKRKQVNLVAAPELTRLEGQARRLLHAHEAWVVDEADKTRRHFQPHVTVQETDRLYEGDTFLCEKLYVVVQRGDYKQIESEIIL